MPDLEILQRQTSLDSRRILAIVVILVGITLVLVVLFEFGDPVTLFIEDPLEAPETRQLAVSFVVRESVDEPACPLGECLHGSGCIFRGQFVEVVGRSSS